MSLQRYDITLVPEGSDESVTVEAMGNTMAAAINAAAIDANRRWPDRKVTVLRIAPAGGMVL